MSQREVWVFCDCPGCPHGADISDVDGMNLCAECFIEYSQEGKRVNGRASVRVFRRSSAHGDASQRM
jgi:hypothetical protein